MERRSGIETTVSDLLGSHELLSIIGYDIVEADDQFHRWYSRHEEDCTVLRANPLTLKYVMPTTRDPDRRLERDIFVRGKRKFRPHRLHRTGRVVR